MQQPPGDPARQSESYQLGWVRGFDRKAPRPLVSDFPTDQKHRDYVMGYEAGEKERLATAWKIKQSKDGN